MTERVLPGIGLTGFWDQGAPWKVGGDQNWLLSSVLTQLGVESATTSLPASPLNGVIYIVPVGDPNANQVAARDNGAWVYFPPQEGWTAYVRDTDVLMNFDGTDWVAVTAPVLSTLASSIGAMLIGFMQAGTGAVLQTVQDKSRESWTVKDFGAVADGVTDNLTAWTTAGVAANIAGIKYIGVPDGAYAISGSIPLLPGVTIGGKPSNVPNATAGYGVRIIHTATAPNTDLFVSDSGVIGAYQSSGSIQNMSITASTGNTRYGLYLRNFIGALPSNLQFNGGFTGAPIAFKGSLNSTFTNIRILNGTSTEVPAAIRMLSGSTGGVVDLYSTTATFRNIYVSGKLAVDGPGGFTSVFVADPGGGKQIVFDQIVYESIKGKAFDIAKGNQVIVKAPYSENVPNSDVDTPMFEVGVTGGSGVDAAYDSATSFVLEGEGGDIMQYTQGAATLTRLINADVCQYLEVRNLQLDRVVKLISGTNNTQQFRFSNLKSSSITTVQTGLTDYKIFDMGGNVFTAGALGASHRAGLNATRQSLPLALYSHTDNYYESDVGTEGRASWLDKAAGLFRGFVPKSGIAPTTRSWTRGDPVVNAFPAIGGAAGWRCTATGTGGAATFIFSGQSGVAKGTTAARPTKTTFQVVNDTDWQGAWYMDQDLRADGKPIMWNGAAWVDLAPSAMSVDHGDAAFAIAPGQLTTVERWATPLTADRAATLSTTNARNGDSRRVLRTAAATGAFNLNVGTGPLKALAAGQWCDVMYDGSAWVLTGFGSL